LEARKLKGLNFSTVDTRVTSRESSKGDQLWVADDVGNRRICSSKYNNVNNILFNVLISVNQWASRSKPAWWSI